MYYNVPSVEAPLFVIKISKKTSPQSWRFYFALKQNETIQTDSPQKHPRNARVIFAKERGTTSKNNLGRITLVRGPMGDSLSYLDNLLIKMDRQ